MSTIELIEEFDRLLGDKPYFTVKQLIDLGLFGSVSAASKALKRGDLPSVKVSEKRTVIPRSAALQFFKDNLGSKNNCENV